jgi:DHA1 family tetracycline resistance protein-like MFS transporter
MQTPSPRSTDIRPLLPIYLVIFVAFIGYAMMVNFFVPLLMHDHGFLSPTASTAQRTTAVGILLAIYPLGQFFGSPILGALSDRYGRKPILLASLAVL